MSSHDEIARNGFSLINSMITPNTASGKPTFTIAGTVDVGETEESGGDDENESGEEDVSEPPTPVPAASTPQQ